VARKKLTFISFRQKPIKVSRRSFTLVDIWAFLTNFTSPEFFAIAVIAHFMPPGAILSIEKPVST
jgi:hypothetical protein